MKTIIYSYIIAIFIIVGFSNCTDLDEHVYSALPEDDYNYTVQDFLPTVGSIYPPLRSLLSRTGYYVAQEVTGDGIVMPPNASGWDDGGLFRRMHNHTWSSEQQHVGSMWETFYKGVGLCNKALEKIETGLVPSPGENEKRQAIAEIKSLRAFYYWLICDNYGDVPLQLTTATELLGKSSRKDVFNTIEADLTESFPNLNKNVDIKTYGKMNYWSAKALLANLYLNAEVYTGIAKWTECKTVCDEIIGSKKFDLEGNFKDAFRANHQTIKETILAIPFDKKYAGGNNLHMFSWHASLAAKFQLKITPWGAGCAQGVTQFINTYNPKDTRLEDTWIMGPQYAADGVTRLLGAFDKSGEPLEFRKELPDGNYTSEMEGYRVNKFEVLPETEFNSDTDFPFFRYSQILLMKAECLLRQGSASEAATIVTDVRKRNFKNDPSEATVTGDKLKGNSVYEYGYVENYKIVDKGNIDAIEFGGMLDELGWEFIWEAHRRRDLIRFGVFTKKSWLSHKPQGDYRTVFPIPNNIIISNPLVVQNPNYTNK